MDVDKKRMVRSILRFIKDELSGPSLDPEQKESLDVARQCLETTYDVNSSEPLSDVEDLKAFFQAPKDEPKCSEEDQAEAESYKVKGNDCMKNGQYAEALKHYTKAIELNSRNAVYYCNRAAAYSRLEKHNEVISDCRDAIKLDPNYGKAYGRLGIAYSNMNMYREAKDAYAKARQLDPANSTYEANYLLAEEKLNLEGGGASSGIPPNFDFNSFMNNPALLNMASQMLNDPAFRNIGQQLAVQLQNSNPNFIENLRQTFAMNVNRPSDSNPDNPGNPDPNEDPEF